jgi:hypothetical protein
VRIQSTILNDSLMFGAPFVYQHDGF